MAKGVGVRRLTLGLVAVIATAGATWVNPPVARGPQASSETKAGTPRPRVEMPGASVAVVPPSPKAIAPRPHVAESSGAQKDGGQDWGIILAQWAFSPVTQGRPLSLSMTLEGTQAAVDDIEAGRVPKIEVRWVRENAGGAPGAPDLVTELTIGRPGLADTFQQEVRRRGFFEWHSRAAKDALSPGTWTVSLTYPNGEPVLCKPDAQPCRFTINVG